MFQLAGIAWLVMFQSSTAATPDAGNKQQPDGNSLFRLNSITKVLWAVVDLDCSSNSGAAQAQVIRR